MTREQKLQAVVDAARASVARWRDFSDNELSDGTVNLRKALAALDAPDTADETVTLAVWALRDGEAVLAIDATDIDRARLGQSSWRRLGTVTLPLTRERGE